eukprot:342868-Alexandrium_andersonii.AAC.1
MDEQWRLARHQYVYLTASSVAQQARVGTARPVCGYSTRTRQRIKGGAVNAELGRVAVQQWWCTAMNRERPGGF